MSIEDKIKAAEEGSLSAAKELASLYENGDSSQNITPDPEKAVYYQRKAAEAGDSEAMYNMAVHCFQGTGIKQDLEEACKWAKMALEHGENDAQVIIDYLEKDFILKKKADGGDSQAMADYAQKLMSEGEYDECLKYARKAAEMNNGDAVYILALAYDHGRGVDKSTEKAVEYYKKGAELGNACCMNNIALYYMEGKNGVEKDENKAIELLRKAAGMGNTFAYTSLAYVYETGRGTEQSFGEAIKWYEKYIAECGDSISASEITERVAILRQKLQEKSKTPSPAPTEPAKDAALEDKVLEKVMSMKGASLDDIAFAFPKENKGRIRSILFNFCQDGKLLQDTDGVYYSETNKPEKKKEPVPPVPLEGIELDVYMFAAKSRSPVSLDDIAFNFPNETRGRIRSVLYNLSSSGVLDKTDSEYGDVYSPSKQ